MSKDFTINIKNIPSSIYPEVTDRINRSLVALLEEYGISFTKEVKKS